MARQFIHNYDKETLSFPVNLASIADGDVVTTRSMSKSGKIVAFRYIADVVASTGGKASTLNLEIGSTNLTGGVISLTTTACGTKGAVVASTAITANNGFNVGDTISVEASSTTTFSQGSGVIEVEVEYDNFN